MNDEFEDSNTCPLCEEEMDLSDRNFLPCPCGYRVISREIFSLFLKCSIGMYVVLASHPRESEWPLPRL